MSLEESHQACRRPSGRLREVTGQLQRSESSHLRVHLNGALALTLVTEEEKETILAVNHLGDGNGSADGSTKLIPNQDRSRLILARRALIKEIIRVQVGVPQIVERTAMHLVGAGFG